MTIEQLVEAMEVEVNRMNEQRRIAEQKRRNITAMLENRNA